MEQQHAEHNQAEAAVAEESPAEAAAAEESPAEANDEERVADLPFEDDEQD